MRGFRVFYIPYITGEGAGNETMRKICVYVDERKTSHSMSGALLKNLLIKTQTKRHIPVLQNFAL